MNASKIVRFLPIVAAVVVFGLVQAFAVHVRLDMEAEQTAQIKAVTQAVVSAASDELEFLSGGKIDIVSRMARRFDQGIYVLDERWQAEAMQAIKGRPNFRAIALFDDKLNLRRVVPTNAPMRTLPRDVMALGAVPEFFVTGDERVPLLVVVRTTGGYLAASVGSEQVLRHLERFNGFHVQVLADGHRVFRGVEPAPAATDRNMTQDMRLGGRAWTIVVAPGSVALQSYETALPQQVYAGLILVGTLASFLTLSTWYFVRLRQEAVAKGERVERLNERLTRHQQLSESILSATPDAMVIVDGDGAIVRANRAVEEVLGYKADELVGRNVDDLVPARYIRHAVQRQSYMRQPQLRPMGVQRRLHALHKSGREIPVEISLNAFDSNGTRQVIAAIRDVSARATIEDELRAAKRTAEAANLAKDSFLAAVSHDLRTPLGIIMGYAQLLAEHPATAAVQTHAHAIFKTGQDLSALLNDLLDLAKVEAHQLAIDAQPLLLRDYLSEVASRLRVKAEEKHVKLSLEVGGDLPAVVVTDKLRLGQIITNVVGNAIKFTEQGRVDVTVKKDVDQTGVPLMLVVVKDTGIGLSAEQQAKLFRPFQQADTTVAGRFGGTGLGLSIARRLAELLGGSLVLAGSKLGVGSTFELRVRLEAATGESVESAARNVPGQDLSGLHVLVVDDVDANRFLLSAFLSRAGATVEQAGDGKEAVQKAIASQPDVILMDIQMPSMDGNEATHRLRERGFGGPIIALTAHTMKGERERCLSAGFSSYLAKPVTREALLDAVVATRLNKPQSAAPSTMSVSHLPH